MKLREMLYMGNAHQQAFLTELAVRGLILPSFKNFSGSLIIDNETPYLDMIELMELYPEYALKEV